MLTVVKVSVAQGGVYARYLEGRAARSAAGDYYLRDGERVEAPGRWVLGRASAGAIGVADAGAPVDADVFRSLMAVVNPATGERLRRVGGNGDAVGAIDCTFSAPKSVSAVWALGGPELRERLEVAHESAVDAAVAHAIEFVPMVRRRVNRETVVRERPPDPQLHSHVLVHAAVRGDGEVVAVESRAWLVHQREVGAAYRNPLVEDGSERALHDGEDLGGLRRQIGCEGGAVELRGDRQLRGRIPVGEGVRAGAQRLAQRRGGECGEDLTE